MITTARWITPTGFDDPASIIRFTYDVAPLPDGKLVIDMMWSQGERIMDRLAPLAHAYVQGALATPPTTNVEAFQIELVQARRNFRSSLDQAVALSLHVVTTRDSYYDSEDRNYFLDVWPDFFAFQKWINDGRVGDRPTTPILDRYATVLMLVINKPAFTLNKARGRLRKQLNTRRFRIMAEKVDGATGELVNFTTRQEIYISMQKEAKQYRYSQINNSATLTVDEKASAIDVLANTMIRRNGTIKPFRLDGDPLNPIVVL